MSKLVLFEITILLSCLFISGSTIKAQSFQKDSLKVQKLLEKGYDAYNDDAPMDSTINFFEKSEQLALSIQDWEAYVLSLYNKSAVYYKFQAYTSFEKYAHKSLSEAERLLSPNHTLIGDCLNQVSVRNSVDGNFVQALNLAEEARRIFEAGEDSQEKYSSLIVNNENIGLYAARLGRIDDAVNYYNQALNLAMDSLSMHRDYFKSAIKLNHKIGLIHFQAFRYDLAIIQYEKALNLLEQYPDKYRGSRVRILNSMSDALLEANRLAEADIIISKAENEQLAIHQKFHKYLNREITFRMRAMYFSKLGTHKEAFPLADSSILYAKNRFKHLKKHHLIGNLHKTKGIFYAQAENWDLALDSYQSALIQFTDSFASDHIYDLPPDSDFGLIKAHTLELLSLRIKAFWQKYHESGELKDLTAAWNNVKLFVQLEAQHRTQLFTEDAQRFLTDRIYPTFENGIQIAATLFEREKDQNFIKSAFWLSEKSKSISLLANLSQNQAKFNAGVPAEILELEKAMNSRLDSIQNLRYEESIKLSADQEKLKMLEQKTFPYERKLDSIRRVLASDYPTYFELYIKESDNDRSSAYFNQLNSQTLLIEYFWGENALYIFAVDNKKIRYKEVADIDRIHPSLQTLLGTLHEVKNSSNDLSIFKESAHYLYQHLFDTSWDSYQNYIIVPDALLGLLPFEVLLSNSSGNNFLQLPYLIKDHNVQYAYSAKLLFDAPKIDHLKKTLKPWAGFAPKFEGTKALPYSINEVEQIAGLMEGQTYTQQHADKATFLKEAGDFKILHLATHGYPNIDNPQFAHLEFTTKDHNSDGILYAHELMNQQLAAELVVLSACETGYGSVAKGEGIMSLARSFRYAGASNIVMSLWKAESGVSQQVMTSFYQYLNEGKGKGEALKLAKVDYISSPFPGRYHPRAWANFILTGDAPKGIGKSFPLGWILALLLPALLVIFINFRRILALNNTHN